jgi:hypothetical protein
VAIILLFQAWQGHGRAGVLLEETLPPTGAQQNALRPIMIAIWGAVNQATQQQFLVEMKKRADKR